MQERQQMNSALETPEDWTAEQSQLYGRVLRFMVANQEAFRHPDGPILRPEHWQTVCHNAAWTAADLLDSESLRIIDGDTGAIVAQSPEMLNS
jgi:hypothetical protein